MNHQDLPVIAITMGDPNGIGPETIVHVLAEWDVEAIPVVVGDKKILLQVEGEAGLFPVSKRDKLPVRIVDLSDRFPHQLHWGEVSPSGGRVCFAYLQEAVQMAMAGQADAIVTAPISKEAVHLADVPYIGHTEMLQSLTGTSEALTMFQVGRLRVFFLTRHLSLAEAVKEVKYASVLNALQNMEYYLRILGVEKPRLAVAALNPHAGDGGLLGKEEEQEISPAVQAAREHGIDASGPYPADSVFWFAHQGNYDGVLSLYHDQGHIATKCIDFHGTVSITLGLPFIRTSPDHGTAFDIAGTGKANPKSLKEAAHWAATYAKRYKQVFLT